jgi:hypothetical protein
MRTRFLADADLRGSILRGVQRRESKIDFAFLPKLLEGLPDAEVLAIAASRNRVLVSHDRATMQWHFMNSSVDKPVGVLFSSIKMPLLAKQLTICCCAGTLWTAVNSLT